MKTKLIIAAVAGAATLSLALPASAQVNERQWRQHDRIERGYQRGDLTGREYRQLRNQQRRIADYEDRARWNDGRLSWRERERLNRMQNRASENIRYQRRDWQDRRW